MACGKKPTIKVGDIFTSNSGSMAEVVHYENASEVYVQFLDEVGYVKCFRARGLRTGKFKNPFQPLVYGKGYMGVGKLNSDFSKNKEVAWVYKIWAGMLKRCYSVSFQKRNPTYIGCTVEGYFLSFENFADWYYGHPKYIKGFQLDKDILVRGNKEYSRNTCCFVPNEINCLFHVSCFKDSGLEIGVSISGGKYRATSGGTYLGTFDTPEEAHQAWVIAKEKRARELAIKYQDKLDTRVYNILYNWKYEGNGFEY